LEKRSNTTPPIAAEKLDEFLIYHQIDPALLRADKFEAFMSDRQKRLLAHIEQATERLHIPGPCRKRGGGCRGRPGHNGSRVDDYGRVTAAAKGA
jgi:hypothetical protein